MSDTQNTGQELRIRGYYSNSYDEGYVSTEMCCRLGMEFFLSQVLFKGDLSRVVYSKKDIAFRRRVETVGRGDIKDATYNYVNLDLPFAVYSQSGSYEEDDRGATQNVGQIIVGQRIPDAGIVIKAAALKVAYESTIFFSRRDDVNFAAQLLYHELTPKFPFYFIIEYNLCGYPIDIPVFITLEEVNKNPDYVEKDWLEKSKIFPMECKFTIRSYQTLIEQVDDGIELPIRFSGLYGYNKNEEVVYTQKTSLIWGDSKWSPEPVEKMLETDSMGNPIYSPEKFDPNYRTSVNWLKNPNLTEVFDEDKVDKRFTQELVNNTIAHVIKGYFEEERDCTLIEWHQTEETNNNSVTIEWKIKEDEVDKFRNIVIFIPGITRTEISDVNITKYTVENLFPGSEYDCSLVVTSKDYSYITYKLLLKTTGEKVLEQKLKDNLVGKTFQDVAPDNSSITFTGRLSDQLVGREFTYTTDSQLK